MSDALTSKEIVLSEHEIRELTRLPEALQLVIDYHHHQETEADSLGFDGSVRFHEQRRKELETRRDELLTERGDKPGELLIVNGYERSRAADEPPAVDVAPIAKLTVRDGLVQRAGLYAPGLPDGDHDVYLEPIPAQPPSAWQPIETAPHDREVLFWVVPLSADETYRDTSGNPITSGEKPRMMFCRFGRWSSLSKAIYWADVPGSPTVTKSEEPEPEHVCDGGWACHFHDVKKAADETSEGQS